MQRWSTAMAAALYGPAGFYTSGDGPASHFRTSVTASTVLAEALARWLPTLDAALRHPDPFDVVDLGAGDGRLVSDLVRALPPDHDLAGRVRWTAVDVRPRPRGLPPQVGWQRDLPDRVTGFVVAHELLDNVPVDVVERDERGRWREVLVDTEGREELGSPASDESTGWLSRWWPVDEPHPGDRAEVGMLRDARWRAVVAAVDRGVALAVDYAHTLDERRSGRWSAGTVTAYRHGREVATRLDGSCDVTAHVALDACAAAGREAGADEGRLLLQREALRRLGVTTSRPEHALATTDPLRYLEALRRVGEAHEVLDPAGLGGFTWLLQVKGGAFLPCRGAPNDDETGRAAD